VATVSDTPWGNFSQADYNDEQWARACLVDRGADTKGKQRYALPVREPSGALNRNGVHAAVGGHGIGAVQGIDDAQRKAVARKLVALYKGDLKEDPPEGLENMAGEAESAAEEAKEPMARSRNLWSRVFPLDDIQILSRSKGGDGRTVEAYAAVFDTPQEIVDEHGHYKEKITKTAFNRAISHGLVNRALCLYHHGFNVVDQKPNPLGQVPLGTPLDIKADRKGLLTVTRYNKSALADAVLESIHNGDIKGQSFRGPIYGSDPLRVPRIRRGEAIPTVTRTELGLRDYGPTPTPYYDGATILAVRARDLFADIQDLDEVERAELYRMMLATTRDGDPELVAATSTPELGTQDSRKTHSRRAQVRSTSMKMELAMLGIQDAS
jgi:phage head maturation protease